MHRFSSRYSLQSPRCRVEGWACLVIPTKRSAYAVGGKLEEKVKAVTVVTEGNGRLDKSRLHSLDESLVLSEDGSEMFVWQEPQIQTLATCTQTLSIHQEARGTGAGVPDEPVYGRAAVGTPAGDNGRDIRMRVRVRTHHAHTSPFQTPRNSCWGCLRNLSHRGQYSPSNVAVTIVIQRVCTVQDTAMQTRGRNFSRRVLMAAIGTTTSCLIQ